MMVVMMLLYLVGVLYSILSTCWGRRSARAAPSARSRGLEKTKQFSITKFILRYPQFQSHLCFDFYETCIYYTHSQHA